MDASDCESNTRIVSKAEIARTAAKRMARKPASRVADPIRRRRGRRVGSAISGRFPRPRRHRSWWLSTAGSSLSSEAAWSSAGRSASSSSPPRRLEPVRSPLRPGWRTDPRSAVGPRSELVRSPPTARASGLSHDRACRADNDPVLAAAVSSSSWWSSPSRGPGVRRSADSGGARPGRSAPSPVTIPPGPRFLLRQECRAVATTDLSALFCRLHRPPDP